MLSDDQQTLRDLFFAGMKRSFVNPIGMSMVQLMLLDATATFIRQVIREEMEKAYGSRDN